MNAAICKPGSLGIAKKDSVRIARAIDPGGIGSFAGR